MEIITKKDLIRNIAKSWKHQYFRGHSWKDIYNGDAKEKYYQLKELPHNATEEQVSKIIGNKTWTQNECDECERDVDQTIVFGSKSKYHFVKVCFKCLNRAIKFIED